MGARLGRYLVLKHLATGGMADVLLGRTDGIEGFERHVVLKRIRPEHATDLRFIRMFLDEARVAANLHHQHIVQVHDVGESAGEYFIAMEYLHAEDVRTILATAARTRQHVPLGHAIAIVSAAAAGLHYAHERRGPDKRPIGIVHRDISPSNILVGYDGSIKIVDFGIAKVSMRQETRSGGLKGKVSYMSPEQCKCAEIDRRSDVYALGVVLYELATTTRLFHGDNDYLVMDQIVNGRVTLPRVRRPDLPGELSAIIMRAIAPEPEHRYPTADELRIALDQFAARCKLTASTSSIAAYMRRQFGERPEPWLELGGQADRLPDDKLATGTSRPGLGWTEATASQQVRGSGPILRPSRPVGAVVDDVVPVRGSGPIAAGRAAVPEPSGTWRTIMRRPTRPPPIAPPPIAPPPTARVPTDARMGWESQRPARAPSGVTPVKLMLFGASLVALVAILGGALWWFTTAGGANAPVADEAAQPAAPPLAAISPPSPAPDPAPPRVEAATPAPAAAAPRAATHGHAAESASGESSKRSSSHKGAAKPVEPAVGPAPATAQAPVTLPSAPPASPGPVPSSAAPAPPSPAAVSPATPAAPPAPVAAVPQLSRAVLDRAASEHGRALSKCDGGEDLHGEVTVRFTIDDDGNVTRAQVNSALNNPRVAGCILREVQSWRFRGQPAGAQGAYTVSFQ